MAHGVIRHERLRVHQALHGYADGHRLLACSANLKGRDVKTMLVFSDLSGPGARIDNGGYLTGYPLAESGLYAFSRTWAATEMARPGCVWTHTLLIDFTDLAVLKSPGILARAFRRPAATTDIVGYCSEITIAAEESSAYSIGANLPNVCATLRRLLWALYGFPNSRVIATRTIDVNLDSLVLAIWDQQWPRLRRSFRFCTLSGSDRSTDVAPFDLQLVPELVRFGRSSFSGIIDANSSSPDDSAWLDHALTDLMDPDIEALRNFLRRAGGDVTSGREGFAPLCHLHGLVREFTRRPAAVEEAVALLEGELASAQPYAARSIVALEAVDRIATLGDDTLDFVVRNLDLIDVDVKPGRAETVGKVVWARKPRSFAQLLSAGDKSRFVAEHALAVISREEVIQGLREAVNLLPVLLARRPDLVTEPDFWALEGSALPEAFLAAEEPLDRREAALSAMLLSGRADLAEEATRRFGAAQVLMVTLSALDRRKSEVPNRYEKAWLEAGVRDAKALAQLLSSASVRTLATLVAIARVTSPNHVPNDFGEDPWVSAARAAGGSGSVSEAGRHYLSAYWLARALGTRSRNRAELMALSFEDVYTAASRSRLPDEAWRLMESHLPRPWLWLDWDYCQRLRAGVVEAFVSQNIAPTLFNKVTSDERLFASLASTAARTSRGRAYLRHLQRALENMDARRYSTRIQTIEELFH